MSLTTIKSAEEQAAPHVAGKFNQAARAKILHFSSAPFIVEPPAMSNWSQLTPCDPFSLLLPVVTAYKVWLMLQNMDRGPELHAWSCAGNSWLGPGGWCNLLSRINSDFLYSCCLILWWTWKLKRLNSVFWVFLRICRLIALLPLGLWRSVTKHGVTSIVLLPSNTSVSVWFKCVYMMMYMNTFVQDLLLCCNCMSVVVWSVVVLKFCGSCTADHVLQVAAGHQPQLLHSLLISTLPLNLINGNAKWW